MYDSVNLTGEEVMSGRYQMDVEGTMHVYANAFKLKKKKVTGELYHVCIYLGDDNRCTIYDERPRACRIFECQNRPLIGKRFGIDSEMLKLNKDLVPKLEVNPEAVLLADFGDVDQVAEQIRHEASKDEPDKDNLKTMADNLETIVEDMEKEMLNVLGVYHKALRDKQNG
jgi:Fe-S-cluster containining protein